MFPYVLCDMKSAMQIGCRTWGVVKRSKLDAMMFPGYMVDEGDRSMKGGGTCSSLLSPDVQFISVLWSVDD